MLLYCIPLAVLVLCLWTRRIVLLEVSLGAFLFVEAIETQRLVVYLLVVAAGAVATLPARARGATARRWAGGGLVVLAIVILAIPAVPAGQVAASQPVAAFNYLEAHPGRIFTQYTWGDYSVARHRATFVDGRTDLFEGKVLTEFMAVTNLTTNPDPVLAGSHVAYVVWAPHTHWRSTSPVTRAGTWWTAPRWRSSSPAADRAGRPAERSEAQPKVASRPRTSPSSSDQVRTEA